jgi:hypothetical protein
MDTVLGILFGIAILGFAIWICAYKDRLVDNSVLKAYKSELNDRIPIDSSEFCSRSNLPTSDEPLIKKTREALGKLRGIDPNLIYPEDDLFGSLGLAYDDDLSCFLYDESILVKNEWWFPSEEIKQLSDLFPLIHRMNQNSEPGESGNG